MYVVVEKGSQLRTSHIFYLVFPLEVRKKKNNNNNNNNSAVAFANLFISQMSVTKGQSLLGSATRSQESRLEHSFKLFLLILEEVRGQRTTKNIVNGHFGSPSGRERPSNTDREKLANG